MLLEACELTRTERSASKSVRCSQTHQGFVLTEGLDCHRIPGHQQELHRGQCGGGDPGGTQKGSRRYQGLLEEGPSSAPALPRVPRTRWGCVPQAHRFLWTHCGGGGVEKTAGGDHGDLSWFSTSCAGYQPRGLRLRAEADPLLG